MSAQATLAGLFPPTNEQVWNPDLLWQPIPVHTIPKDIDYMVTASKLLNFDNKIIFNY